ncbi:MAG: uracil-DNA glycosylase [Pseudomonadota bacterium]
MDRTALRELLEFYDAAGVDCALGENPIDRFEVQSVMQPIVLAAQTEKRFAPQSEALLPPVPRTPTPAAQATSTSRSADANTLADAEAVAANANSLDELRAALETYEGCGLKKTAQRMVFSDGNPNAKVMLIGEAPGRDEDAQGKPFVGRSGQLLDRMLAAIGLDRSLVYIGNVIYWRPPGNRTPTPAERAVCEPFIRRQIELVRPRVMMTLGGSALATILNRQGIMKTRGQELTYAHGELAIPTVPTLHPAALLRNPANKKLAWHDLLVLQSMIEKTRALQTDA